MKTTVFTPVHKIRESELIQLSNSIQDADEWIVLLNGDACSKENKEHLETVLGQNASIHLKPEKHNIGYLKGLCCDISTGDVLIEVDYDDYLTPGAIGQIKEAFQNPDVHFVYSNSVDFIEGEYPKCNTYGAQYGWYTRPYREYVQLVAFPPSAHYMRRIEWAPNHVRAFRAESYRSLQVSDGSYGYDRRLIGGDDHDLVCRFYIKYGAKGFKHIDDALYMYRVHKDNSCNASNLNSVIQEQVAKNYVNYSEAMYKRWANDSGLRLLDMGGRFNCPEGYESVDLFGADVNMNLEEPWDIEDNSVGVIRAYHIIEHLKNPIHFFNEAYRVLAEGGFLLIEVPSTNGELAWADPTHISFFNPASFEYYTNEQKARFIRPQFKGRFQNLRIQEYAWAPNQLVVSAHLCTLKGGWYDQRWCGVKSI
jgi:SAM-dependent methyltransferase